MGALANEGTKPQPRAQDDACRRAAAALSARLGRVEGQVRGLRRMIESGCSCEEMATQLAATTAALRRAGFAFFAYRMQECMRGHGEEGESMERLGDLFMRLG